MLTAYDIAYIAALTLASPYMAYRLAVDDRLRAWAAGRLSAPPPPRPKKGARPIWVHCASVGELNAARSFIESLDERFPARGWLISTFTESGFEQARRRYGDDRVFYCPFDFSPLVLRALQRIQPACIVLVELEFWPNLLHVAHRQGVPALLVNGRIRSETVRRHKILASLTGSPGGALHACCVQNELYRDRFRSLGVPSAKINVTGNMKYDSVVCCASRSEQRKLREAFRLKAAEPLLVAGSVWPGEESALLSCYQKLRAEYPELRLLIAPRHIERAGEIERAIKSSGLACLRRSEADSANSNAVVEGKPALMLDTVGELAAAYSLGAVAFVGRSLVPGGGQNMLEPAALGVPCVFGPHIENFSAEAELLLNAGAAFKVNDENELFDALKELLNNPERARTIGKAGRAAVESQQGATTRNLKALAELIERQ